MKNSGTHDIIKLLKLTERKLLWDFFGMIKEIIRFRKELKKCLIEQKEKEARYSAMSTEELSVLLDDDLFDAVVYRTEGKVTAFDDLADGVNSLNGPQKVFYALNWLEMEVNNGGLCQFFVNSSRMVAPCISEYMVIVGANEHKKLYDDFISENGIDMTDLSFFDIEKTEEFAEKNEKYPFDDYDDAFYGLEPLETYLKKFIRENIENF